MASKSKKKDELEDYLDSIDDLSSSMKKRVHTVLTSQGIIDPRGIEALTKAELEDLPGISERTANYLKESPTDSSSDSLFMSLEEREEAEKEIERIRTGSEDLNELLGGGVPLGTFVEFYGSPQSGKTQMCYTLAVNAILPKKYGGLGSGVLWLDTEGSFNSRRLKKVMFYHQYTNGLTDANIDFSLFNVAVARTIDKIEMALKQVGPLIVKKNVKLLIVDSLMDPFRAEYGGLGQLADRQKHLNRLLHSLMRIAEAYNLAVVYTNQVMANPDPFATAMDKVMPVGGFILGHASDIRVWLRRATSKVKKKHNSVSGRRAMVTDCGWLPQEECHVSLGPFGVCNIDEEEEHYKLEEKLGLSTKRLTDDLKEEILEEDTEEEE